MDQTMRNAQASGPISRQTFHVRSRDPSNHDEEHRPACTPATSWSKTAQTAAEGMLPKQFAS